MLKSLKSLPVDRRVGAALGRLANMLSLNGDRMVPGVCAAPNAKHEYRVSVVVNPVHALDLASYVREDTRCLLAIWRSHAREIGDRDDAYAIARFHNGTIAITKRRARHWVGG
jgi:hypothetical protein